MHDMACVRVDIGSDHPAFDGHFPGQPLLPGVVLLSEVLEALLRAAPEAIGSNPRISTVKFLAPVRPGAHLEVRWTGGGQARLRFQVWRHAPGDPIGGVQAASGQLEAGAP